MTIRMIVIFLMQTFTLIVIFRTFHFMSTEDYLLKYICGKRLGSLRSLSVWICWGECHLKINLCKLFRFFERIFQSPFVTCQSATWMYRVFVCMCFNHNYSVSNPTVRLLRLNSGQFSLDPALRCIVNVNVLYRKELVSDK